MNPSEKMYVASPTSVPLADSTFMITQQDMDKIIWSMHHIVSGDPCRRFVFGITIETLTPVCGIAIDPPGIPLNHMI